MRMGVMRMGGLILRTNVDLNVCVCDGQSWGATQGLSIMNWLSWWWCNSGVHEHRCHALCADVQATLLHCP